MKTEEPNPYQPTVMEDTWREEINARSEVSKPMTWQDLGINLLVIVWFFLSGGFAFKKWMDQQWVISIVFLTLCLMSIPISVRSEPLAKRVRSSFVIVFCIGGVVLALAGFFHISRQAWFTKLGLAWLDDLFGLLAFALLGLVGGGYFGWRFLMLVWPDRS